MKNRFIVAAALTLVAAFGASVLGKSDPVAAPSPPGNAIAPPATADVRPLPTAASRPALETPVLLTMAGRPVDLDGLDVAHFLDGMAVRARRGDVAAAYRVYQAECLCATIDRDTTSLRIIEGLDADDRARSVASLALKTSACAGVTPAQMHERFGFLDQAVRAGHRDAMLDYRAEGPLGLDIESLAADDVRLTEWKRRANAYLETLAAQGNREAWSALSWDYQAGLVVDRDDWASIKYQAATDATSRRPDRDPLSWSFVADMARTMQPKDVQAAIAEGRALARRFPALHG